MSDEWKQEGKKAFVSRIGDPLFGMVILVALACGCINIAMHFVPDERFAALEAHRDCAGFGHQWRLAKHEDRTGFVIIDANGIYAGHRWNFCCRRCAREFWCTELTMTDGFWQIVERASGLKRPEKQATAGSIKEGVFVNRNGSATSDSRFEPTGKRGHHEQ